MTTNGRYPPDLPALVRATIDACCGLPPGLGHLPTALVDEAPATVEVCHELLDAALDRCWSAGWTPADLVHVTTRQRGAGHGEVVANRALVDGRRRVAEGQRLHRAWHEQLAYLEDRPTRTRALHDLVRWHVEVLGWLGRLPSVPRTMPRPGEATGPARGAHGPIDARLLERVRALLAKAESTTFEQEAEAFTSKAQELIARHAIDEALLHDGEDIGETAVRRVHLDDPYADAKAMIVGAVGAANRCRAIHSPAFGWVTVFGFDHDLDAVELLTGSLLAQATATMVRHGPQRDASGRSRTRSFRHAFLLGFGQRVGQRLREVTEEQVAQSESAGSLVPVLAARDEVVAAAVKATFPQVQSKASTASNPVGWEQGRTAANHARLNISPHRLPTR